MNTSVRCIRAVWPSVFLAAFLLTGCYTPEATGLEDDPAGPSARPEVAESRGPAAELAVEALEIHGVRGGRISFVIDGSPSEILEMLLDLDRADGHRAWARSYRVVSRSESRVRSVWNFEGRMGVNPTVEVEHEILERGDPVVLRFALVKPAFGLAAFFGDYRIHGLEGDRPSSLVEARIYIDSGLVFVSASAEDIASGLREDVRLMREWMIERAPRPAGTRR